MNIRQILQIAVLILPLLLTAVPVDAQDQPSLAPDSAAGPVTEAQPSSLPAVPAIAATASNLQRAREQLQSIQQSLINKRRQVEQLRERLAQITDAGERDDLQKQITAGEADMSALRRSFENISLGGVDSSVFDTARQSQQFNWQQELQLILEPLIQKMKELTEKPRQVEEIKNRIALLDMRQTQVSRALENLRQLRDESMEAGTLQSLDVINQTWMQQLNDIERDLGINRLRLTVMLEDEDTILQRIRQSLNEFITGSGRNLALAIVAFLTTLMVLKGLFYLFNRLAHRNSMLVSNSRRIVTFGFHALTALASIMAALMVLYMLGDMMLLVIAVIILVLLLLGLRNKLPVILEESRLLLDVGAAREHERVIYRDLPWSIRSLGVYSHLYNPALEGLLRLPMSEMLGLISRPCKEDEPWFPTSTGDWVMFADGSVGQVLRQTPEVVNIRSKGSIISCPTVDFMNERLCNLSQGFGVSLTFGIDYQHQADSTTTIPGVLEKAVTQALQDSDFVKHVVKILVEFHDAGASSLNYLVHVNMNGAAADSYYALSRLLQKTCVDCCNTNGWVIPFNQITLNAGTGFDPASVTVRTAIET